MSKANQIVFEVGEEYGLTREQSLELWNQYWSEFVLRNMISFDNTSIIIKGLGTFFIKMRKLEKRIEVLDGIIERHEGPAREKYLAEREKKLRLVESLKERNSKVKRKRIYG